jgi:two-component sensor histidine kinase
MSDPSAADRIRALETENARLRRLLERRGMPSTLRHQVRNALGLMRAVLRRSADSKSSVEDLVAHVEGRFDALLRVETALLSSPDGRLDFATLVSDTLLAQAIKEGEDASIQGPAVRVEAQAAELLGLVLHELAVNAVKFGSLGHPGARIDVSWTVTPAPEQLAFTWMETGQTPAVPPHRGFGTEAIEGMLPYQLKAQSTLEFLPEGVRCRVSLPLASADH